MHREAHAAIRRHALVDPGRECLGMLGADASGTVVRAQPLASGRPDAVSIPYATIDRATTAVARRGLRRAGLYHSHPGRAAIPSEADRLAMTPGELLVIVSLPSLDVRAYVLDDARRHAVEILLEIVPGRACAGGSAG